MIVNVGANLCVRPICNIKKSKTRLKEISADRPSRLGRNIGKKIKKYDIILLGQLTPG